MVKDPNLEFSQLFANYHDRVYRIILRLTGNPADAEELTQDTFIKVDRHLGSLEQEEKVSSWVYRIATNAALDHVRQRSFKQGRKQLNLEEAETDLPDVGGNAALELDRNETNKCVRQYAEQLPEQYRAVLVLHELEGLSLQEVAEATDSSLAATKVRLHRARQKFATLCEAECEHFYNEENNLCCEPKGGEPKDNKCCPS